MRLLIAALASLIAGSVACAQENIGGIGVALGKEGDHLIIHKLVADKPAAKSGEIHEGDQLIAVAEGDAAPIKVDPQQVGDATRLIRGPAGSTVRLTIIPKGQTQEHIVSFVRDELKELWGDGKMLARGTAAPGIRLTRLTDDQPVKLADYRGKVIVLEFWATWCGPCQSEVAKLQTLESYHPNWKDKVVILTASIDDKKETVVNHLKERGWNQTINLLTDVPGFRAYHVEAIPCSYVIDGDGKIAASARDPEGAVEKLLGK